MDRAFDIVIVGAGIVGAACAEACARAGLRVLVLERAHLGGGTTGAGMGHLVVMDDSEPQFALTHYSRGLWRDLAPRLPDRVEYDPCGTLWVAADEEEMEIVHRKHRFYAERSVRTRVLDAAALAQAEPNLRPGLAGGLIVEDDAVLYPPAAARFLLDEAARRGTQIRVGIEVRSLQADGTVILAGDSRIAAGYVVNAAGCDSPALTSGLPVRRRKGHLLITDRHPGFVHHQIVELGYLKSAHSASKDSVAFNIQPRKTGQMLIGSSRQFDAIPSVVEQPMLHRMLQRATQYLPHLPQLCAIRTWTGDRAATPDKLPLIGPIAEHDRRWLATGHEGLGITTSLGTGQLLADLLCRRPSAIPAAPYAPTRVSISGTTAPSTTASSTSNPCTPQGSGT